MTMTASMPTPPRQHVYNVSEVNLEIKRLLEDKYLFIWISGEISNLRIPSSGHCYFTLKDSRSQLSAVMFRNQFQSLAFRPKEGLAVIGFGRISVYEPRGAYQIIFEYLEPQGIGNLQIAFEDVKRRLTEEGLFAEERKRPLPAFPKKIGIVTSPTGAAVHDFIKIARRRLTGLPLVIAPVRVQGPKAPQEIVRTIAQLNKQMACDVIVVARGGGSIEDLWAFNDEHVARAIAASRIPVVSAVGHETDFTIADFVADLRAPTPSAAAELVAPSQTELAFLVSKLKENIYIYTCNILKYYRNKIDKNTDRIVHPQRRLHDWRLRVDDLAMRATANMGEFVRRKRERLQFRSEMLRQTSPANQIDHRRARLDAYRQSLIRGIRHHIRYRKADMDSAASTLEALNPMAILQRGYSITRRLPDRTIIRSTRTIRIGQHVEVMLGHGRLRVTVDEKESGNEDAADEARPPG